MQSQKHVDRMAGHTSVSPVLKPSEQTGSANRWKHSMTAKPHLDKASKLEETIEETSFDVTTENDEPSKIEPNIVEKSQYDEKTGTLTIKLIKTEMY